MRLQVLVSALDCDPEKLVREMGISGDAILVNQCDRDGLFQLDTSDGVVDVIESSSRGVGLSRNTALGLAAAELVLFADDDVSYYDGYGRRISEAFDKFPHADVVLFDLDAIGGSRQIPYRGQVGRRRWKSLKYGGPRIAVRLDAVRTRRVSFSQLFGGGSQYASGEDTLFLRDCLASGMKIFSAGVSIGAIDMSSSSWFAGHGEEYRHDRGALYSLLFPRAWPLMIFQFALRHRKLFEVGILDSTRDMWLGHRCIRGMGRCDRHSIHDQ